jgi:predicted Zn-ribbon and HTH transcriptional regulator
MCPHPSRYVHKTAGNARTPITVRPRTRRECGHTYHGTSTKPQGMWIHPSWYVHKTSGNEGKPISVRPQNRRECGHTHHGTSTKPQGMWAHLSWYIHKTAGNVGTPILVRPNPSSDLGTPISDLRMQAGFGPFLRLHHRLLRNKTEPSTRNSECFHPS